VRRVVPLFAALALSACQRTPDPAPSAETAAPDSVVAEEGSASGDEVDQIDQIEQIEVETAPVWIGLSCLTADPDRAFSIYVDGAEHQRIDCRCEGEISKDVAPNCGQFILDVPVGVRTLRVQDDTGDAHAEADFGITSERWITVSHREVGEGAGFLTSFDEWQNRPPFAISP
jgi:hypothetical protein